MSVRPRGLAVDEVPGTAIVLVHGLWMHGIAFAVQRRRLNRRGYRTHLFSYRSVRGDLEVVADALAHHVDSLVEDRVCLVGHSLGGLVILTMLARHCPRRVHRAVLLGSPCAGSHTARAVSRIPGLARLTGQPLRQWFSRPLPEPSRLTEVGIVAGHRAIGVGRLLFRLPLPNDGVVAVDETRWPWATDSITLRVTHLEMLFSTECIEQTMRFLDTGAFAHCVRVA